MREGTVNLAVRFLAGTVRFLFRNLAVGFLFGTKRYVSTFFQLVRKPAMSNSISIIFSIHLIKDWTGMWVNHLDL